MFGYVIPVKCELKVREFDQFRAAYCGLCHSLRDAYGLPARFILNYDFTFLAILLSAGEAEVQYTARRCVAKPFRRKTCCVGGDAFRRAAGYSVILGRWRLRDGIADCGFVKGIPTRFAALLLHRAYRRAVRDYPDFDAHCKAQLGLLGTLEQANSPELDRVADAFAQILPHAADHVTDAADRRSLAELLYHTGRWIYLIDAYDDLARDKQTGAFNPLLSRFAPADGVLGTEDKARLETTLNHSVNRLTAAYNLLAEGAWSGILENIIYLGFPAVTKHVLEGGFQRRWGRWRDRERKENTDT